MSKRKLPRGLRNNNPLNIIKGKQLWLGQTHIGSDSRFCQFSSMSYGFRAALKLLRTYYQKHGCSTLRQIISRWAPASENDVEAYIQAVCQLTGLKPDTGLPPMKRESYVVWTSIVLAMASVECGLTADDRESLRISVYKAWKMLI